MNQRVNGPDPGETDARVQRSVRRLECHPAPPIVPGVLGEGINPPAPTYLPTDEDRMLAMLCHLLAIFTGWIGPLILWLVKKNDSPYVDAHGRATLNFQFTTLIVITGMMAGLMLSIITIVGMVLACLILPLMVGWSVWVLVISIIHCVDASKGIYRPYPMSIPFFSPAG